MMTYSSINSDVGYDWNETCYVSKYGKTIAHKPRVIPRFSVAFEIRRCFPQLKISRKIIENEPYSRVFVLLSLWYQTPGVP